MRTLDLDLPAPDYDPGPALVVPPARTYGLLSLWPRDPGLAGPRSLRLDKLEPHVIIRLKQLFPRIEKTAAQPYHLPTDPATCADLAWFMQRYPLRALDDAAAVVDARRAAFERTAAEMEAIAQPTWAPGPAPAGFRAGESLRTYQAQAVEILRRSGGLLLGDDLGLGKTVTAAGACLIPGALPAAVVVQPHLQRQWVAALERFTTLRVHAIKTTKPAKLPPADVYVWRYSNLAGWSDMFEGLAPRLAVFDEIQELRKGQDSEKGRAARRLADLCEHRLGLSATPIYNYGDEIYSVMQFLKPGVLGTWAEFAREWLSWGGRKVADPLALGSYLREQHVFLRRTKTDVGQELPKVTRLVEVVDHDAKALQSIEDRAKALALRATTGTFTERGEATRELDLMLRMWTGVAKARAVAQVARILVEGGTPIVLVGWHRDVYAIWNRELADLKPVMFTGSESAAAKARAVNAFLAGDTDVFIMSLRSGAGLDGLQKRCSTMVFGELDWSPGVHAQCIGRLDREGQSEPVTALFLVSDDGSDPPMMSVLGLKASQAAAIIDPGLGPQAVETDGARLRTLVERYLDKKAAATMAGRQAANVAKATAHAEAWQDQQDKKKARKARTASRKVTEAA